MKSVSPAFTKKSGLVLRGWNFRLAFLAVACCVFFTSLAFAQEATILGTVTDSTGAVVPNAAIVITNTETGITRNLPSNGDGQYVAPELHIGNYTVRATATGFKVAEKKDITLDVGNRTRIDFKLEVGNIKDTVTVEATAVAVQTDSGEVSNVVTGQQIAQLATNGRSLLQLMNLTPGASSNQGDRIAFVPVGADNSVSINGQRSGHNLQMLDGGENLDRGGTGGSVAPSLDAIAEFRELTSNYSAEYGLSSAATVTTVIKSGTNQFHASAWEFLRNDALNARNYFNQKPAKVQSLRYNIYGFNLGGQVPLWKEHPTFFFYNQEWRKIKEGANLNQVVPLVSTYGGNFGSTVINAPTAAQLSPALQAKYAADLQPLGAPFTNNTIPADLLDPNAQALLTAGIFPAPTNGSSFQGGATSPVSLTEQIARVDHTFSDKFSIFGHWVSEQISQTYATTQWSGDNVPTVRNTFGNPSYSAVVHATYVINPTLVNEVAFNYNGNRIAILPIGVVAAPPAFGFNRLFTGPNAGTRIPSIHLSKGTGTNYTSSWEPWINKADDYQFRDDISWTHGAHQLKFGFSWAIYKKIQDAFATTQGNFNFDGSFTGNDFADFLLGYSQQYQEDAVKISGKWNNISPALYVQDNWRVNNRLTLNLGLRWDGIPHTYEANQQSSNFYPGLYTLANTATFDTAGHICSSAADPGCAAASPGLGTSPNPILAGLPFYTNGLGIGGKNGAPKGLVKDNWLNFGPRLGFAYDVTGGGKTVVRGGFALQYDRIQGNDVYNGATNPPGNLQPTLNNVSLSNPGTSITTGNTITAANLPILAVGVTGIDNHYKPPVSYQYSFGVQQALGARGVLSINYVGSQARHLNDYRAINLPLESALPALVAAGGNGLNQQVQYLGYGGIRLAENEANSHYNSLQVSVNGHVRHDLYLQAAYTLSKAIDASTGGSGGDLNNVTNPYVGWRYDVGPSQYDRRHIAFLNFVYDIPLFKNGSRLMKATLGGWQASGIINLQSGAPLNLGVNGTTVASVLNNTGTRPNLTGSIKYPHSVAQWFDPTSFSAPVCATGPDCYGNLPFDAIRGPGRDNWNLSLLKNFAFTERFRMEFRAETFNTWNHTQFKGDAGQGGIDTGLGSSTFGRVKAAFDPREVQLGLKLIF